MIDEISDRRGLSVFEAGKYTELQYWHLIIFDCIRGKNEKASMEKK